MPDEQKTPDLVDREESVRGLATWLEKVHESAGREIDDEARAECRASAEVMLELLAAQRRADEYHRALVAMLRREKVESAWLRCLSEIARMQELMTLQLRQPHDGSCAAPGAILDQLVELHVLLDAVAISCGYGSVHESWMELRRRIRARLDSMTGEADRG